MARIGGDAIEKLLDLTRRFDLYKILAYSYQNIASYVSNEHHSRDRQWVHKHSKYW